MKPETRIGLTTFVKILTYIVSTTVWAAAGYFLGTIAGRFIGASVGYGYDDYNVIFSVIGAVVGFVIAFFMDFFVYTTFIRIDEILLALNAKNQFDAENSKQLNETLRDIKILLNLISGTPSKTNTF